MTSAFNILLVCLGGLWLLYIIATGLYAVLRKLGIKLQDGATQFSSWQESRRVTRYRRQHSAQIVGVPDLDALRKISALLSDYLKEFDVPGPAFSPNCDTSYRYIRFVSPLDAIIKRDKVENDGPEPLPWETTLDVLPIGRGASIREIYEELKFRHDFPATEPQITYAPPTLPKRINVKLPSWDIKIISLIDSREIERADAWNKKVYEREIAQVNKLETTANEIREEIRWKLQQAGKLYLAAERFASTEMDKYRSFKRSLAEDFLARKSSFQNAVAIESSPIQHAIAAYQKRSKQGIEQHFSLGLQSLALPLPGGYPWKVLYDDNEKIIQINQRVPLLGDIKVRRPDSRRDPAKRDSELFLRSYLPAISMRILENVAVNDLRDDVSMIAVNCWARFFERSTGRQKDAFIASVRAEKQEVLKINVEKADAVEAFRGLRGTFVFSLSEIVPIEPQIRLDKDDKRFVDGKDILDGMAQGQNLATMDWEDFEHLIRELLSKEYGRNGSEVKITRASRDRGVDAIIFDPDPLHGGKYVVQAKRYNNTVDVSAVRDLYGTMHNEGAARGILVTTSKYGRDAFEFVENKPMTLIDGEMLLWLLAKHGYKFKIELGAAN
jgi:restriction system protein